MPSRLPLATMCAGALLALAAPADAAWRELPAYDLPGGASALCLRPAGPAGLTVAAGRAIERLTIGADALTSAQATPLGRSTLCPEPGPGAVPLLAGPVVTEGRGERARWRMAVSAADGAPTLLAGRAVRYIDPPAVAVSATGAAVVAWVERPSLGAERGVLRVATRPSASAPFARPQRLGQVGGSGIGGGGAPQVGVDDAGRAHVAWTSTAGSFAGTGRVATAAPGRPFARPRTLTRGLAQDAPALAVAADGRALLVAPGDNAVELWELAPGAPGFARGQRLPIPPEELSVALRPGGAAALVGRARFDDVVVLARRDGRGRFGRPELLLSEQSQPSDDGLGIGYAEIYSVPDTKRVADHSQPQVAVALGGAGELVVSWFDRSREGLPAVPHAWRGAVAGRMRGQVVDGYRIVGRGTRLGSPCRVAGAITPVTLADGRVAVAWSDDGRGVDVGLGDWGTGAGRVHVAVPEGSATSTQVIPPAGSDDEPAPRAEVRLLGSRTVGSATPLRLRVRCADGPCDLRVSAPAAPFGGSGESFGPSDRASDEQQPLSANATVARAGGSTLVRLAPGRAYAFAQPRRSARLPISVTVCTPAGKIAQRLTLTPRLTGRPLPPTARIVGLRATRLPDGRIRLSWRLSRPVRDRRAFLSADLYSRSGWQLAQQMLRARGRTRFALTLTPEGVHDERPVRAVVTLSTSVSLNAARATVRLR